MDTKALEQNTYRADYNRRLQELSCPDDSAEMTRIVKTQCETYARTRQRGNRMMCLRFVISSASDESVVTSAQRELEALSEEGGEVVDKDEVSP